jgi:hypothetical protein
VCGNRIIDYGSDEAGGVGGGEDDRRRTTIIPNVGGHVGDILVFYEEQISTY